MANKPIQKFTLNFVTAAVWENGNDERTWFKVMLAKSYKDGDEYKSTESLDPADLPYGLIALFG